MPAHAECRSLPEGAPGAAPAAHQRRADGAHDRRGWASFMRTSAAGLRHHEGWIGYGVNIHHARFAALATPGTPLTLEANVVRSRRIKDSITGAVPLRVPAGRHAGLRRRADRDVAQARRGAAGAGALLITLAIATVSLASPMLAEIRRDPRVDQRRFGLRVEGGTPTYALDCAEGTECDGSDQYIASITTTVFVVFSTRRRREAFRVRDGAPARVREADPVIGLTPSTRLGRRRTRLFKLDRLAGSTAGVTVNGEERTGFGDEEEDAVFYTTRQGAKVTERRTVGGASVPSRGTGVLPGSIPPDAGCCSS